MLLLMIRDSRRNTRTPNYKRVIIFSFVGGGGGGDEYTWPNEIMGATLLRCYTRNAIAEKIDSEN